MAAPVRRTGILRRLAGDRRGVSAVEFALLAPIMIAFYFGLAEFCQGYMAQKRMGHASAMVADLVSQTDIVTPSQLTDIFEIGGLIMKPFSATPLKMRISQVTRDNNGVAKVNWSRAKGMPARTTNQTVTLPAGLIDNGESIIMSEATYDYDSPVDYLMPSVTQFSHTYYLRPRLTEQVTLDTN